MLIGGTLRGFAIFMIVIICAAVLAGVGAVSYAGYLFGKAVAGGAVGGSAGGSGESRLLSETTLPDDMLF
jgi:hypothetical protein